MTRSDDQAAIARANARTQDMLAGVGVAAPHAPAPASAPDALTLEFERLLNEHGSAAFCCGQLFEDDEDDPSDEYDLACKRADRVKAALLAFARARLTAEVTP